MTTIKETTNKMINAITAQPVKKVIRAYQSYFSNEDLSALEAFIDITPEQANLFNRKNSTGHITASGLVINKSQLLLVEHPVFKRWIQPGGHIEQNESTLEAAMREIKEETHYDVVLHPWHKLHPYPFDIDTHKIEANPKKGEGAHLHFDFRYLFTLKSDIWNNYHESDLPLQWNCLCNFQSSDLSLAVAKILFHENIFVR